MDWVMFFGGAVFGAIVVSAALALSRHADEKKEKDDRDLYERIKRIVNREISMSDVLTWDNMSTFIERTNAALAKLDPPKRRKGDKK